jgi:hypothetical protein
MIWALFLLMLSVGALAAGVGYVRKAAAMKRIVPTSGTVISRKVVVVSGGTREGAFGQGGRYAPKVTYRYTVDGREHTSDKLGYALRGYKQEVAARRLAAIPTAVRPWTAREDDHRVR